MKRSKKLQRKIHKQANEVTRKTKRDLGMESFLERLARNIFGDPEDNRGW